MRASRTLPSFLDARRSAARAFDPELLSSRRRDQTELSGEAGDSLGKVFALHLSSSPIATLTLFNAV
jgi:hypothetical protein